VTGNRANGQLPKNGDLSKFNPSNPLAWRTWSKSDFTGSSWRCDCASIDDASSILFYGRELDGLGKRLRAFFAPAADGPIGRIIK
jgi:hypothetical protein